MAGIEQLQVAVPAVPPLLSPRFRDVLLLIFAAHLDLVSALRLAAACKELWIAAPFARILERNIWTRVERLSDMLGYVSLVSDRSGPEGRPRVRHLHLVAFGRGALPGSKEPPAKRGGDPLKFVAERLPAVLSHPCVRPHLRTLHLHEVPIRPTTLAWISARGQFPFSAALNAMPQLSRVALWDPVPVRPPQPRPLTEEDLLFDDTVETVQEPLPLALEGLESFGKLHRVRRVEVVFRSDVQAREFWQM
ncbi:hypothetical protein DFJ74DRAFT_659463 [Hyaloraphidium curvatum]|nr:hypothetical protein DFJ74DRAFT_659463 [Hyaloraphidium curvatum]